MAIKKDPAVLQGMAAVFGNREVDFGKPGIFRPIEFRKLMMDKDYIWKLEVVLKGRVDEVEMQYDVSIILDPTSYNEQIDHLWNEANSAQMKMESIGDRLPESLARIRMSYEQDLRKFGPIDFVGNMIKFENKPLSQQLLQFKIDNKAAQEISKLLNNLDKAAIVLSPTGSKDAEDDEDDLGL